MLEFDSLAIQILLVKPEHGTQFAIPLNMRSMTQLFTLFTLLVTQVTVAMTCAVAVSVSGEISASILAQDRTSDGIFKAHQMEPSVHMIETKSSGHIIFRKSPGQLWKAFKDLHPGGQTPQGDLRWPIALVGVKTAEFLGFKLKQNEDGSSELWAPNAQLLAEKISKLNQMLKKLGFDPITFSTVSRGFLSSSEMLQTAMMSDGETLVSFPYADKMKNLTPHEIAFHLGAIIFRKQDNLRARTVNLRTLQLYKLLKSDPDLDLIAEKLMDERANELDVGTAGPPAIFGEIRINSGMADYKNIPAALRENYIQERIIRSLGLYTKSKSSPVEAVIHRIFLMTGVGREQLTNQEALTNPQAEFNANTLRHGVFVSVNESVQRKLSIILKRFREDHKSDELNFPMDISMQNFENIENYMHQRIQEFEAAIATGN